MSDTPIPNRPPDKVFEFPPWATMTPEEKDAYLDKLADEFLPLEANPNPSPPTS